MDEKKCEGCGKVMNRFELGFSAKRFESRRFCSKQCRWKDEDYRNKMNEVSKKVNINPSKKQVEARFKKGHTINNGKHRSLNTEFKSREENPNWKGGTSKKYGLDWETQKRLALERDKCCQRCGGVENLHIHHIKPYRDSKDNDLSNLIVFCRRCHIIVERHYGDKITKEGDIIIKHIPPNILERFLRLADNEFEGETGFTLKYLIDIHDGVLPTGIEQTERAEAKADEALNQIQELKNNIPKQEEEKKTITLLNGKKLKR